MKILKDIMKKLSMWLKHIIHLYCNSILINSPSIILYKKAKDKKLQLL